MAPPHLPQTRLVVQLMRSVIKTPASVKATIRAMGFRRTYQAVSLPDGPVTWGQLTKVSYLVDVRRVVVDDVPAVLHRHNGRA